MYNVCYAVSAVHPSMPDDLLVALNEASVEGLALVDSVILRYYNIPSIYTKRPKYRIAPKETWKDIGTLLGDGWGDCKDFVAWRLAELRKQGVSCKAESIVQRQGNRLLFHTYIRFADGHVEDPARELGMP